MNINEIKSIIREECERLFLIEKEVTDPDLQKTIREFAQISDQIDRITNELKQLKQEYSILEDILRPILESLQDTKDKALEIDDILITIKKAGYERTSFAYKEAFDWLHERVNPAMRKIVQEALDKTKKTSKIASNIGVQYKKNVNENIYTDVLNKLKTYWNSFLSTIKLNNQKLDKYISSFKNKFIQERKNRHTKRINEKLLHTNSSLYDAFLSLNIGGDCSPNSYGFLKQQGDEYVPYAITPAFKKYFKIAQKLEKILNEKDNKPIILTYDEIRALEETQYDGSDAYQTPEEYDESLPKDYDEQIKVIMDIYKNRTGKGSSL